MMKSEDSKPASTIHRLPSANDKTALKAPPHANGGGETREQRGIGRWLRNILPSRQGTDLREALEEYIGEASRKDDDAAPSVTAQERNLIANVLKFRDLTVVDVMIPRADISAIEIGISQKDLLSLLSEKQFSRFPVYRETLDEVLGTIHIKDLLASLARGKIIEIEELVRDVPIVSPSMPVLDLVLMMKQARKHMALVVDEYGGIDGLVTIGDVIEAIFGDVEDEHGSDEEPQLVRKDDGSILADARYDIEEFEKQCGRFLSDDERADIDTIGGLIFAIAGRIPGRGEVIKHPSGMVFEVIDADPRRVNQVIVRNIPAPKE